MEICLSRYGIMKSTCVMCGSGTTSPGGVVMVKSSKVHALRAVLCCACPAILFPRTHARPLTVLTQQARAAGRFTGYRMLPTSSCSSRVGNPNKGMRAAVYRLQSTRIPITNSTVGWWVHHATNYNKAIDVHKNMTDQANQLDNTT